MGLDEILPDEADKSGSGSSRSGSSSSKEYHKTITGPAGKEKKFTEERWGEIRRVIIQEFDDSFKEVMNNYKAKERYSVVHDASLFLEREKTKDELGREPDVTCSVCGAECSEGSVVLEGEKVCAHHPAAKVAKEMHD